MHNIHYFTARRKKHDDAASHHKHNTKPDENIAMRYDDTSTIGKIKRTTVNACQYLARLSTLCLKQQQPQPQPLIKHKSYPRQTNHERRKKPPRRYLAFILVTVAVSLIGGTTASASSPDLDKADRFLDKINEQSIAAVFNKVAYGSTTKRSIPDNAYLYTTLATPLLTTYRYSDGNQEWYRVDVKEPELEVSANDNNNNNDDDDDDEEDEEEIERVPERNGDTYGSDLEKDHVLPTSAPAADILKNNNNRNYNNPNRYNNDMMRPERPPGLETVTEREPPPRTSTGYSVLRNVRPTKSMFGKDIPSYVPPSRSFFTPPLPPELLNPFADKPTLRGTNSEGGYSIKRPLPPPSVMPDRKERVPYRPDFAPPVTRDNSQRGVPENDHKNERPSPPRDQQNPVKVKTLNTPSGNTGLLMPPGLNHLNDSIGQIATPYLPSIGSITRLLAGTNGPRDNADLIPDVLRNVATSPPKIYPPYERNREPIIETNESKPDDEVRSSDNLDLPAAATVPRLPNSSSNVKNPVETRDRSAPSEPQKPDTTTTVSDILNLPNVNVKTRSDEVSNATKAATSGHEIWHICWNVHVYLVVFLYVLLAIFSIVKLIRFERETHMFSKSYFLSVHLLLTTICVLRIFYLAYDPYNVNGSFTNFTYDLLHNLPLSLLATTFAVLIVFLLKRTLNHLKVKTRPVFLVLFGLGHMFLCFCLNLSETFGLFNRSSFLGLACRFVYILLCWSLGLSYVYLYKIIKNVLAKKSQNLSEMCTQNISYASHITIAIALLFTLLGFVQLYGLFFIKVDRFTIPYHWILWGFELSVRLLEISIVALLAIVVSLRMSQREKQTVGFPLFPCTTSDSSTDNIYPNNCSTNLNALNYSLRSSQAQYRQQLQHQQELALENLPTDIVDRPNLLIDQKSTLDRCFANQGASEAGSDHDRGSVYEPPPPPIVRGSSFDRFERPTWGGSSQRFAVEADGFPVRNFERSDDQPNSGHFERNSSRAARSFDRSDQDFSSGHFEHGSGRIKPYEKCRYYAKPKYDSDMYNTSTGDEEQPPKMLKRGQDLDEPNVYSEPLDVNAEYERSRHDMDRTDLERRSRTSWNNSGRRSMGRSGRKAIACRPHTGGVHTLPNQDTQAAANSMLVDENGFVRFRALAAGEQPPPEPQHVVKASRKHHRHHHGDVNHYSDA